MERNEPIDSGMGNDGFGLTDMAMNFLHEAARWGRTISIIGFIFLGLIVLMSFFVGSMFSNSTSELSGMGYEPDMPFGPGLIIALYILIAAIYFFPTLYLYRFSTRTKAALESSDSELLTSGIENLKSTFKYIGILLIIVIAFYALGLLLALFGMGGLM